MSYRSDKGKECYISASNLLLEYRHFIDSHASLSLINQANSVWPSMVTYCKELEAFPDLMKAITTLHSKSQIDFERALFCSWISLVMSRFLNLAQAHQRSLFLAGLLQDLGKHSVDEEVKVIVNKVNGFGMSNCGEKATDLHPLVGSTYVERMFDDHAVSDLILNHHARYDGTGYPQHLSESQLDLDHQILIIANEISDHLDALGGHNNLEACIPMLQVGSFMFFSKAYSAWYELLSKHFDYVSEFENLERAKFVLHARKVKLEKLLACLISLSGELLRYDFDLHIHGLRTMIQKLAHMFTDTGVLNKNILETDDEACQIVISEIDTIFKGIPAALERCKEFIDELKIANKFEINGALLSEARSLLSVNITELGNRKASIFR